MKMPLIQSKKLLAIGFEDFTDSYWVLAYAYARKGNIAKGVEYSERYVNQGGAEQESALLYALLGMPAKAELLLTQMESESVEYIPGAVATAVAIGQENRGLAILERAVRDNPDGDYFELNCLEETRSLRGNPRYDAVLEELGWPQ